MKWRSGANNVSKGIYEVRGRGGRGNQHSRNSDKAPSDGEKVERRRKIDVMRP